MSAEKIASSLTKQIFIKEIHKYRNLKDIIQMLKDVFETVKLNFELRSDFLEMVVNRKFDHKALKDITDRVCSQGINSKAVISCKKEPIPTDHGILSNVPILIKDNMETFEFPLTLGTEYYEYLPAKDSDIVSKLRSSGAIILGITNMHELALGTTGINEYYGTPLNPVCPERIPGGSSSGSASAVAQGLIPIALGNDAAGSIRVPAAFMGIVGFKFSRDFVSTRGTRPEISRFAAVGVLSKRTLDLIPIFEAIKTLSSLEVLEKIKEFSKSAIKIMIPKNLINDAKEPVLSAFNETVDIAKNNEINVEIYWDEFQFSTEIDRARTIITLAEAFNDYVQIYNMFKDSMSPDVRFLLDIGKEISGIAYLRAKDVIDEYRREIASKLSKYDIILTPTVSREPPRLDEADWKLSASTKLIELAAIWNILETPAVTIPSPVKLPCGVNLGIQLSTLRGDTDLLALSIIMESILKQSKH